MARLCQKHLGMVLDTKLAFQEFLKSIFSKISKTIGLLLSSLLDLISIMVASYMIKHITLHFTKKIQSISYNTALV